MIFSSLRGLLLLLLLLLQAVDKDTVLRGGQLDELDLQAMLVFSRNHVGLSKGQETESVHCLSNIIEANDGLYLCGDMCPGRTSLQANGHPFPTGLVKGY